MTADHDDPAMTAARTRLDRAALPDAPLAMPEQSLAPRRIAAALASWLPNAGARAEG